MARIIALDFGLKRTGIAMTDTDQLICSPHSTQPTHQLLNFLDEFLNKEPVEAIVMGMPLDEKGNDTDSTQHARGMAKKLKKYKLPVYLHDERYTSKMAMHSMITAGAKKKDRAKKENIDKVSAAILLQSFMENYQKS